MRVLRGCEATNQHTLTRHTRRFDGLRPKELNFAKSGLNGTRSSRTNSSHDMSSTLSLPNDLPLPLPSHSASSLDPLSTPSSASDFSRPKSERRLSLAVLDSAKFRLSHDVRVPCPPRCPLLSPSVPNTCCTHAFFSRSLHVSSGHPAHFPQSQLAQEGQP